MSAGRPRALDLIRSGVVVLAFPAFAALSAAAQPQTVTALADQSLRTQTTVLEIVVKFKEADRTKAIVDAFWSRPQVAQVASEPDVQALEVGIMRPLRP